MTTTSSTLSPTTLSFGSIGNTTLNRSLVTITSALSLFGALVIIITYFTWKDLRSTSRKILVYISIADSITVGSYLFGAWLPPNTNSAACTAQSFLSATANLWSFFWTTFLAIFLYMTVARQKPTLAKKMFSAFHVFGFGVPFLIVFLALEEDVLGNDRDIYSSAWCWIKVQDEGESNAKIIFWILMTDKLWEVIMFILVIVFYGLLKCHIRREVIHNERQQITNASLEAVKNANKKLQFVPPILLFLRFWGMLRFYIYITSSIHESESVRHIQEVLIYIQGVCESAQGFVNFLLFCLFTERFKMNFRKAMSKHCPGCFHKLKWTYRSVRTENSDNSCFVSANCSELDETSSLIKTSFFHSSSLLPPSYPTVNTRSSFSDLQSSRCPTKVSLFG